MLGLPSFDGSLTRLHPERWKKLKLVSVALLFISVFSFCLLFDYIPTSLTSFVKNVQVQEDAPAIVSPPEPSLGPSFVKNVQVQEDAPVIVSPPKPPLNPRISVIVIWRGNEKPYLNNFFTSYRANADTVQLVFIIIRGDEDDECVDLTKWTGPPGSLNNIKVVCYSLIEYWALHRDYFCDRWKCNKGEADHVLREMIARAPADSYHSHFRLWRGYVFKHLLDPGGEWWGWADPDTFVGNFKSQFPWDATDYDVVIPVGGDADLLYMRGHLCFFRAGHETEEKLNLYDPVSRMVWYFNHHRPHFAAEEAEFSAFILREPQINFLIVPQLLIDIPIHLTQPNTAKFSNLHGVYAAQWPWKQLPTPFPNYPMLSLPTKPSSFLPTFSTEGTTYPIELIAGNWSGYLWFPEEFATHYNLNWNLGSEGWRRFVGRGGGYAGGSQGVWTRLEPPREAITVQGTKDPSVEVKLAEGLYIHWFEEKHNGPWFKILPEVPLLPTQTLVTFTQFGAEIWDHEIGQLIWRGPGKEETTKEEGRRNTRSRFEHRQSLLYRVR